jgi:hypothetical protein
MANETIRTLTDGEELVLTEETAPSAFVPEEDFDPRADGLERRRRALAGRDARSSEGRA